MDLFWYVESSSSTLVNFMLALEIFKIDFCIMWFWMSWVVKYETLGLRERESKEKGLGLNQLVPHLTTFILEWYDKLTGLPLS